QWVRRSATAGTKHAKAREAAHGHQGYVMQRHRLSSRFSAGLEGGPYCILQPLLPPGARGRMPACERGRGALASQTKVLVLMGWLPGATPSPLTDVSLVPSRTEGDRAGCRCSNPKTWRRRRGVAVGRASTAPIGGHASGLAGVKPKPLPSKYPRSPLPRAAG